jgi:microcystin-dependent protein
MTPFLGQILPVAFNFAPKGWAMCSAQLLSIQQNAALFAILGTTYGGNGITTFGLPDLRGRLAVGMGQGLGLSNYSLGQQAGKESATMLLTNMPMHNHLFNVSNTISTQLSPSGNTLGQGGVLGATEFALYGASAGVTMASGMINPTGSTQPFNIIQPCLTVTYCIAMQGIFPSRN